MNITTKKLPKSAVQLHVEVDEKQMVEYFGRAYERLASSVQIKGFRPGAAPKSMILDQIGIDRYTQEAVNLAIVDTYYRAVHEEKLVPLTQPAVAIHEFGVDEKLVYDATVDVLPVIELGDYKKLKVKLTSESTDATDEDVQIVLRRLRLQAASFEIVDRPAADGDRVELNFTGKEKGVVQDDLTSQHYPIILGDTPLIPGFQENLVGLKKGESKSFKLKVDKRSIEFTVDCLEVESVSMPTLDDAFAKTFGHDTVEALTTALKAGIENEKKERQHHDHEQAIVEALEKSVKVEIPQSLIEQEIDRRVESIREQLGVTFDKFLAERHQGKIESLRATLTDECERSVKAGLILGEVAQKEKLVPVGGAKTPEEQRDVMHQTVDKLISYVSPKKK